MITVNGKRKTINVYKTKKALIQQTLDWKTWIIANGGTISDATLQIFNDYFFVPAVAAGGILNKLDRICVYKGATNTNVARTNLIQNRFHATLVNSPTWSNSDGFSTPSGTGYINWNLDPLRETGLRFTNNDVLVGLYIKNASYAATYRAFGNRDANTRFGFVRSSTQTSSGYANNNTAVSNSATFSTSGIKKFYFGSKFTTAQNAFVITPVGNTTTPQTPTAFSGRNLYELTSNETQGLTGFDPSPHCVSFIGSNSMNLTALETILDNLLTRL